MSDVKVPPLNFEEEPPAPPPSQEEEEFEVVLKGQEKKQEKKETPAEEEVPAEYKGKTKKELVEMLRAAQESGSQTQALKTAIEGLGERLATPQQPRREVEKEIKQVLEDDPQLAERFNKEIFGDNPYAVVHSLVERVAERVASKFAAPMAGITHETQKQLLMLDPEAGPIFRKYQAEIETFVANLEPQYRSNPGVWRYALDQIRTRHLNDIVNERVQEELKKKTPGTPQFQEPGGGPKEPVKKKRKVEIDLAEMEAYERRGVPRDQYVRMKAEGEI